jgi:Na+/proline symporter
LQSVFGVRNLAAAIAIGVVVLVVYSVAGGMIAAAYTDLLQGGLMIGAAVAVFVQALRVTGGWSELTGSIAASDRFGASFLEPFGGAPALTAFGFLFVFGVGVLGQPHMLHKFYMLRDPSTLRWLPAILGGGQAACVLVWVGIGLAVPALVAAGRLAPLERPDDASALFLIGFVPDALAGVILAAVLAAIMSTADSFLNIGSAALVRDLPRAFGRPVARELAWGRMAVVAIAILAATLAHAYGDLVALLGTLAFGTFAAALAPTLAIGLNWSRVTGGAAAASIATGLVVNLGLESAQRFPAVPWPFAAGVQPSAVALASSFLVLLALTLRSAAPCRVIAEDIREVVDEVG